MNTPPPSELDEVVLSYLKAIDAGAEIVAGEWLARFPQFAEPLRHLLDYEQQLGRAVTPRHHADTVDIAVPTSMTGAALQRVGRYEIRALLGRGGMGVAYQAWDPRLKRDVVLKRLRSGREADDAERSRFRSEAEAIARVRHPNIVEVFDVAEDDGQPHFAMEFCDGGSLAERLTKGPLKPADAAALIESIAKGVAAAHAQQVIHRDLKPGNILFQGGVPKVADFGLAKKLDDAEAQTRTGAIVGTPSYMAPEQAFGESKRVGPPADLYALGAILYECLTGRPPFRGATSADTLDQVRRREPVAVRQLQPRTPVDLETITLKCLQKEPAQRYASATALADDLRRFLESRSIVARQLGLLARGERWCRRNPSIAALLALVFASMTAGIVGTSVMWRRSAANLDQAQKNFDLAEENFRETFDAVHRSFTTISEDQLPLEPGSLALRKQLLTAARPFFEKFVEKRQGDLGMRFELALATYHLAEIARELDPPDKALAWCQQAQALFEKLAAERPNDLGHRHNVARALNLGGVCLQDLGRNVEAEQAYARSAENLGELSRLSPSADYATSYATSLCHWAIIVSRGAEPRRFDRAEKLLRQAVSIYAQVVAANPNDSSQESQLAFGYFQLGNELTLAGRWPASLVELEKARTAYDALVARPCREQQPARNSLATTHAVMANVYGALKRESEAHQAFLAAEALWEKLVAENPTAAKFRRDLAANENNLGLYCKHTKSASEAEAWLLKALQRREQLHREQPANVTFAVDLGNSCRNLAVLANSQKRLDDVIAWNGKAVGLMEECMRAGGTSAQVTGLLSTAAAGRAKIRADRGQHAEALADWDHAVRHGSDTFLQQVQTYRALSHAAAGSWCAAREDVAAVLKTKDLLPSAFWHLGCALALASSAAASDAVLAEAERKATAAELAHQAVDLLRRAKADGHFEQPGNAELLSKHPFVAALRARPDFQALLK